MQCTQLSRRSRSHGHWLTRVSTYHLWLSGSCIFLSRSCKRKSRAVFISEIEFPLFIIITIAHYDPNYHFTLLRYVYILRRSQLHCHSFTTSLTITLCACYPDEFISTNGLGWNCLVNSVDLGLYSGFREITWNWKLRVFFKPNTSLQDRETFSSWRWISYIQQ